MLRLPNKALAADAARKLKNYQRDVDRLVLYSDRVAAAKKKFPQYNRSTNQTFIKVRKTLAQMCSEPQRCGYCEDSYADEIEHIRPKDLYPEQVFYWENYVYVCGRCNITKLNKFAVLPPDSDDPVNVTRGKNDPVIEPFVGDYVFIDPRLEHALDYMELDLVDTFFLYQRLL